MSEFIQSAMHWLGITWLAQHGLAVIAILLALGALTCAILARFGVPLPPRPGTLMKGRDH